MQNMCRILTYKLEMFHVKQKRNDLCEAQEKYYVEQRVLCETKEIIIYESSKKFHVKQEKKS